MSNAPFPLTLPCQLRRVRLYVCVIVRMGEDAAHLWGVCLALAELSLALGGGFGCQNPLS